MYYRLNDEYELRGWNLLPFGLCDSRNGQIAFMSKENYMLLYHCDGIHDISRDSLSRSESDFLDSMISDSIVSEISEPSEINSEQKYIKYDSRLIKAVQWSITGKCNFKCRHCFMSAPHAKLGELSHDDCIRIIHELASCGIRQVSFTGGEPLIRKDFFELVDELIKNKIILNGIYSNGKLVTDELLDKLEERGLHPVIHMSFDGVGWHDWLRGIPGAEEMALDAFRLCRERGFETTAEMCIHRNNVHTFRETMKLLGELGVSHLKVNGASPMGEWAERSELTLSRKELNNTFLEYVRQFFEEGMPIGLFLAGCFACDKNSVQYGIPNFKYVMDCDCGNKSVCGHARNSLYISPEGFALPCMIIANTGLRNEFPNILEVPLGDILKDSFYMKIIDIRMSDYLERNPDCLKCEYKNLCGAGCRGFAIGNGSTDYLAVDEDTCYFFTEGYHNKVKAVADETITKLHI